MDGTFDGRYPVWTAGVFLTVSLMRELLIYTVRVLPPEQSVYFVEKALKATPAA